VSLIVLALIAAGCRPAAPEAPDVRVNLTLHPSPPQVGSADVTVTLADAQDKPLEKAKVRLEGNMNHAGMVPTFADLEEIEPGTYRGTLQFTMGGDWFILATVTLPDGQRMERKIDVPGVQAR
jgi:hypothetical protein